MYFLVSEDGPLEDFANGKGLQDFRTWMEAQKGIPTIKILLDEGVVDHADLPALRTELAFVQSNDPWIQECLDTLRRTSKKAQDILILSNGETDDDEDEDVE
jgi:hypothetical protein